MDRGSELVGIGSLLSIWIAVNYLSALRINRTDYYALLLASASGLFLMVGATDLIMTFIGVELASESRKLADQTEA